MSQFKISTIIPVYNSEKYLEKCIDSVINQTINFKNIQLIIVNDGSTDNSESIILSFLSDYDNIVYLKKENGGQSSARNLGLKSANGEFVSFVDSDDWIEPEMYEVLYEKAVTHNLNIVTCDYTTVKNGIKVYNSTRFVKDDVKNFIIMNVGPCNMIIRKTLLEIRNFTFPEGIIYEDIASIPVLGLNNNNIFLVEKSFYNYLIHDDSSMNQIKYSSKLNDIFQAFIILKEQFQILDSHNIFKEELEYLFIRRLLMSASLRFIQFDDPENCLNKIHNIMKESFPKWNRNKYYKKLPFKQKLVAKLAYKRRKKILKTLYILNNYFNK